MTGAWVGVWAAPGHVWTTGAFAAELNVSTLLHLDLSTVLHLHDLSRTCVDYCTGACAAPGLVYSNYTSEACDLYVLTLQGPELHLSRLHEPVLLPSSWTCLNYRGLWYTWTCLHHSGLSCTCMFLWTLGACLCNMLIQRFPISIYFRLRNNCRNNSRQKDQNTKNSRRYMTFAARGIISCK